MQNGYRGSARPASSGDVNQASNHVIQGWSSSSARASRDQARVQRHAIRRLRVDDLLGGAKEAILEHEGQDYRLRITSNHKLILTK